MNRKLFSFFLLFGFFLVLNPFKNVYASVGAPNWYQQKKSEATSYIEYSNTFKDGITVYNLFEISEHKDEVFTMVVDGDSVKFKLKSGNVMSGNYWSYNVDNDVVTTGKDTPNGGVLTGQYSLVIKSSVVSGSQLSINPLSFKGINWDIDLSSDLSPGNIFPAPASIDDDDQFGYNFELPSNNENINLHVNSSISIKVPFRVKAKNFYALGVNKATEFITDNFKINNYKTEVTSITWEKKPDILGMSKYATFYVDGFYYINTSTLPNKDTLIASIYNPSQPWLDGSVNVTYTYDGSQPSYNPSVEGGTGGSINNEGNVNIGGTDYGELPSAPVDGDIADWFQYIGSLLLWLVTYPFKLLGQMVSTLTGYITNMFGILTPVTKQLNDVLSFVPVDILNVCWGFLSFTILYSVLKSVFKMIRG